MGMTIKEIIDGLQFTIDMFLFNPSTGEIQPKHLLNEDSRLTVDACEGAIETMRKYQKLQANYEARLKADMVTILDEYDLRLYEQYDDTDLIKVKYVRQAIQQKINELKAESEDKG